MYNRYIRNDNGAYTRIPQEDAPRNTDREDPGRRPESSPPPSRGHSHQDPPPHREPPPREEHERRPDGLTGILQHFLDQLHLDHVDTGDLLLLGLLFFLFREDADEELLVALGLLLIL